MPAIALHCLGGNSVSQRSRRIVACHNRPQEEKCRVRASSYLQGARDVYALFVCVLKTKVGVQTTGSHRNAIWRKSHVAAAGPGPAVSVDPQCQIWPDLGPRTAHGGGPYLRQLVLRPPKLTFHMKARSTLLISRTRVQPRSRAMRASAMRRTTPGTRSCARARTRAAASSRRCARTWGAWWRRRCSRPSAGSSCRSASGAHCALRTAHPTRSRQPPAADTDGQTAVTEVFGGVLF